MNSFQQPPAQRQGSSGVQGDLWSERATDWANYCEAEQWPVFEHALQATHVAAGTRLLDVGCGSGYALSLAVQRGAVVHGLDAAEGMLAIARQRVPHADLQRGEMEALPFADESFDVVTGFNAFHYAASPVKALREARRVTRAGGLLAIVTFGAPADCDALGYLKALGGLMVPALPGPPPQFALSEPGKLAALVGEAGWVPLATAEVACLSYYRTMELAIRAYLSPGLAVKAMRHAGLERTREAIAVSLRKFERPDGLRLTNKFRCLVARR